MQLDDNSAEAHTSLAIFKLFYEYDWAGCEREFRRAFALNPNYAFAHDQFGMALAFQGRFDEAIAEGKRAAELDPLSPQIPIDAAMAFMFQGKLPRREGAGRRAAELDPTFFFPRDDRGLDRPRGRAVQRRHPVLGKGQDDGGAAVRVRVARVCLWRLRRSRAAMAELANLKKMSPDGTVPPFNLALVNLGLGDRARRARRPRAGLGCRFAVDGVAGAGPDLRSASIGAALHGADEEVTSVVTAFASLQLLPQKRYVSATRVACCSCVTLAWCPPSVFSKYRTSSPISSMRATSFLA